MEPRFTKTQNRFETWDVYDYDSMIAENMTREVAQVLVDAMVRNDTRDTIEDVIKQLTENAELSEYRDEIFDLLETRRRTGNFVRAIKILRSCFSLSLREAVDVGEHISQNLYLWRFN
jgi:ribosomal protein L7/L12